MAPALALLLLCACEQARAPRASGPVYEGDVGDLLAAKCGECHTDADAGADYRIDSYAAALGCPASAPTTPATAHGDADPALLTALERENHKGLLDAAERARLHAWVDADAPRIRGAVHGPGILNPRSPDWHGRIAATDRYAPLTWPEHPSACGRCHAGAPATPRAVRWPAAGAPACSECHREPEGVLACGTCHGDGASRAFPPRDRCAFTGPAYDAHRAHLEASAPLRCTDCHPPADGRLRGTHADGRIDVRLDPAVAGDAAAFDAASRRCSVSCHARGGARPEPTFGEAGPLGCGDCHGAPPESHYAGRCDACHVGPNADGTALVDSTHHLDGRADVRRGCADCHGSQGDPTPATGAHRLHRDTQLMRSIGCDECHLVPDSVDGEGHLDRDRPTPADVVFGARARARGQQPRFEDGGCREVACHGAGLIDADERALRWDARPGQPCAGCHGLPPGGSHPQQSSCAAVSCHGDEVSAGSPPALTAIGRERHIDGHIDHADP